MNNENLIYDAEKEMDKDPNEGKTVVYDYEEEIRKKEIENGVVPPEDTIESVGGDADDPSAQEEPLPDMIDENQPNVFDNGLKNGEHLVVHRCPMCGLSKRSISELYGRKRFRRKKIVVGYMSICANCGFVALYATDANQLLGFLRGKVVEKKVR